MIWLSLITACAILVGLWFRRRMAMMAMGGDGWMWPLPGRTAISSPFGSRTHPITGQVKFHNGIDIPAPVGTMVLAPYSGRVKSVYSNATGGNQLVIEHDDGRVSGYAHLHLVLVEPGEHVQQGEPIAQVGNTGASTGAHLHFTVRPSASAAHVDPQTLFA